MSRNNIKKLNDVFFLDFIKSDVKVVELYLQRPGSEELAQSVNNPGLELEDLMKRTS